MSEPWFLEIDGHRRQLNQWAYPFLLRCLAQVEKDGIPFELRVDHESPLSVRLESEVDIILPVGVETTFPKHLDEADDDLFIQFFDSGERGIYRLVDIYSNEISFPRAQDVEGC